MSFDGNGDYLDMGNPASLQIIKDQTISMWIQPTDLTNRQNPYAKAYGGEGTITLEPSGQLSYYCGSTGINSAPHEDFKTLGTIEANKWTHIAIVRPRAISNRGIEDGHGQNL